MDLMVCVGSSCHLQHSRELIDRLKALIAENGLEGKVELKGSFCMGHCAEEGVCVKFDDQVYSLTLDTVDGFFASKVVASGRNPDKSSEGGGQRWPAISVSKSQLQKLL